MNYYVCTIHTHTPDIKKTTSLFISRQNSTENRDGTWNVAIKATFVLSLCNHVKGHINITSSIKKKKKVVSFSVLRIIYFANNVKITLC